MTQSPIILKIAVPIPLNRLFDFLPMADIAAKPCHYPAGCRVLVPFGRKQYIGIIVAQSSHSALALDKLKPIKQLLDTQPILPEAVMQLAEWAAAYYHHPLGEVLNQIVPLAYRDVAALKRNEENYWVLTAKGHTLEPQELKRARRQFSLWQLLKQQEESGLAESVLNETEANGWRPALKKLYELGLVDKQQGPKQPNKKTIVNAEQDFDQARAKEDLANASLQLNPEQQVALDVLSASLGKFAPCLIDGITGSGKTEVYLQFIQLLLEQHKQVLVLVPEISLTPQLYARFSSRFNIDVVVLHSSVSKQQRLQNWLKAGSGEAQIVIGTRSAVFIPMPQLGAIVIDEEHDISFKQQDGFRYHARDVAMVRGKSLAIPVILGSATPSLESLANVAEKRYNSVKLTQRAGQAKAVQFTLLDVRNKLFEHGISHQLKQVIQTELDKDNQVLLFQNRRGYSPVLYCHQCGWIARCDRCDANMTVHQKKSYMACHHCDTQKPLPLRCPTCGSYQLDFIGAGTQRVEESMNKLFPSSEVLRIDKDSTRRKGSFEEIITKVNQGKKQILVGTQMLAKGHHFPNVTLVVILNVDQALFSMDFRSMEKLAQLIVQVAGRAGRAEKQGRVILQTHHPEHAFFKQLIGQGYAAFAKQELEGRKQALLPPFQFLALLRSEAIKEDSNQQFLQQCADLGRQICHQDSLPQIQLLGPVAAPMERRSGRYRSQLLIQSPSRKVLQYFLEKWLEQINAMTSNRKVRWSIDIDPQDLS